MVRAPRTGHVPARLRVAVPRADEVQRVEVWLRGGGTLRVRCASAAAVPRGQLFRLEDDVFDVVRSASDGGDAFPGRSLRERRREFDADGEAVLRGLPPGLYRWKVFGRELDLEPREIAVSGGEQTVDVTWRAR